MIRTLIIAACVGLAGGACATHPSFYLADPDRQITESEFMQTAPQWGAFHHWDTDGDGFLMPAEYEAGMRAAGLPVTHGFDAWDTAGDGRLSEEEFYRGMFRTLDPEGRGYVTQGELDAHRRPLGME